MRPQRPVLIPVTSERDLPDDSAVTEGEAWTRSEIEDQLLALTSESFFLLRDVLSGARVNRDAVSTARWVIESNLKLLPEGPSDDDAHIERLRAVLESVRGGRR